MTVTIGQRFGRYIVMAAGEPQGPRRRPRFLCRCDCGKSRFVTVENLRSGHSQSCGCISKYLCAIVGRQSFPRHGYSEAPEYAAWANLKTEAKKHGVFVDPRWTTDFVTFLSDMGDRPSAWHRLRRRNTKGPFDASNCFWKPPFSKSEKDAKRRAILGAWMKKNKELKRLMDRLYYLSNKDRFLVYARSRRALKRNASGRHSASDIHRILEAQKNRCAYCREKLSKRHVDHITPLVLGGSNGRRNLQILCPSCNLRKGAKDPIDYARQLGRLI